MPKYVWACVGRPFAQLSVADIIERIAEDGFDDFDPETLGGIPGLHGAVDAFNALNARVLVYEPDYSKAILL